MENFLNCLQFAYNFPLSISLMLYDSLLDSEKLYISFSLDNALKVATSKASLFLVSEEYPYLF